MNWDTTKPDSDVTVSASCPAITANWDAIAAVAQQQHSKISNATPIHCAGQCSVLLATDNATLLAVTPVPCGIGFDTTNYNIFTGLANSTWQNRGGFVPAGSKMLFYQDTAPTGWTIKDTLDDKVAYVTSGGTNPGGAKLVGGSWVLSGFNGGSTESHVMTVPNLPAHHHTAYYEAAAGRSYINSTSTTHYNSDDSYTADTGNTGDGGGHLHNISDTTTVTGDAETARISGSRVACLYDNAGTVYDITASASDHDGTYFRTTLDTNVTLWIGAERTFDVVRFVVGAASADTVAIMSADYGRRFSYGPRYKKHTTTTAYLTAAGTPAFSAGELIVVTGAGSAYNGTWKITSTNNNNGTPSGNTIAYTTIEDETEGIVAETDGSIVATRLSAIGSWTDGTSGAVGKPFCQSGNITIAAIPSDWGLSASSVGNLYWLRLSTDAAIAAGNGDVLNIDVKDFSTAPWRPLSYVCIICEKDGA